jgi:hypothetical protein
MNIETQYVIVSDDDTSDKDQLYWNIDKGWGDYKNATTFDKEIITLPLPPGGVEYWGISMDKSEILLRYKPPSILYPITYANIN